MMGKRIIKAIAKVSISNLIKLLLGVLIGFLIPSVFSLDNYGYYKLFTLYVSYISIFHFGFIDGVYIDIAGMKFDELNKPLMATHHSFFIIMQSSIATIIVILSLLFLQGDRQFILIFVGISIVLNNTISYYQHISQSTSRFNEYSLRNIIYSILMSIGVILIFLLKVDNYKIYLVFTVIVNLVLLLWYIYTYRSIIFIKLLDFSHYKAHMKNAIGLGFPMLIGYFTTVLIMNISKQIVDLFFDIESFAVYSFSFNLLSIINVFVLSVSVVLFPIIKDFSKNFFTTYYSLACTMILVIVGFSLSVYFPMEFVVKSFLPKYIDSLGILRIIFPTLLSTSVIQIIRLNYYKVNKESKGYLFTGITSFMISSLVSTFAYVIFKTIEAMAYSTVISFFVWYLVTEVHFYINYKTSRSIKNTSYLIVITGLFYTTVVISNSVFSMTFYILLFSIFTVLYFKKELEKTFKIIMKRTIIK